MVATARGARAQCGAKRSTCSACHDGTRAARAADAPWHADHAFADLCVGCHGGRGDQAAEPVAHEGLGDPRDAAKCGACHADAMARLEGYAARDAGAAATSAGDRPPSGGSARVPTPHGDPASNGVVAGIITVVALLGAGVVVRQERRRAADRSAVSKA